MENKEGTLVPPGVEYFASRLRKFIADVGKPPKVSIYNTFHHYHYQKKKESYLFLIVVVVIVGSDICYWRSERI